MSGVALRCPTCGTTQSHPGECDACSDGEVRYFCSNHDPGRWLDEPVCNGCGARFGDAPRKPPAPTPRATPTRPPSPGAVKPPRTGVRRPPPRAADPADTPAAPSLRDLMAHMAEELERRRYRVEEMPRREPSVEAPRIWLPGMGCFLRLVLFALLLIALVLGGLFMLLGGGF